MPSAGATYFSRGGYVFGDSNLPRSCVFCGNVPLTEEHVFPRWLTRRGLINPPATSTQAIMRYDFDPFAGRVLMRPELPIQRSRPLTSMKVKAVCKACNGGWMGGVVNKAKPLLEALLSMEQRTYREEELVDLAAWVALTSIMAEHTDMATSTIGDAERAEFRDQCLPSDRWRIFIGHHEGSAWHLCRYRHHGGVATLLAPDEQPVATFDQQTTFTVGQLAFHAFSADAVTLIERFDAKLRPADMAQIWPVRGELPWPSTRRLNDADMMMIADAVHHDLIARGAILGGA